MHLNVVRRRLMRMRRLLVGARRLLVSKFTSKSDATRFAIFIARFAIFIARFAIVAYQITCNPSNLPHPYHTLHTL